MQKNIAHKNAGRKKENGGIFSDGGAHPPCYNTDKITARRYTMKLYEEEFETPTELEEEAWVEEALSDESWLDDGIGDEEDEFAPLPAHITVKYNGKEQQVSLADAPAFIQKGMNYDHVKEELATLKENAAMKYLEAMARRENITLDEAARLLMQREESDRVLTHRQEGYEPDAAQALAQAESALLQMQAERDAAAQALAQHEAQSESVRAFAQFLEQHPDIDPDAIPEAVWAQVEAGIPMENAWALHENALLRRELATLRQDMQNAARATGSVASQGDGLDSLADPFTRGFFGL